MEKKETKNKQEAIQPINKEKSDPSISKEIDGKEEEQEEHNGIIPDGMDFRKFIGCGG